MKRVMVFLAALAGVGGAVYLAGPSQAQQPAGAQPATPAPAPAPKATGKVAVFNVARVMREYQRWQYFAATMNNKRMAEATALAKIQSEIAGLKDQAQKEPIESKRQAMIQTMVAKQRELEDKGSQAKRALDDESQAHLKNLFAEIQAAVKAIVDANGFDLVMAYPDAVTEEEKTSPMYFDMKMRPSAAMPFYVSPSVDISSVLVLSLNKHFPAPGPVPPMTPPPAPPVNTVSGPGQ